MEQLEGTGHIKHPSQFGVDRALKVKRTNSLVAEHGKLGTEPFTPGEEARHFVE